jgi:hypothetical protein
VVTRLYAGVVGCLVSAALSEGREQAIPSAEILDSLEEAIESEEPPDPTVLDMDRVNERAEPCAFVELERAGVSMDMLTELSTMTHDR